MPAEESTAAIVLRARDYGESDRIVTLLTEDFGKLSGIAKGARKSRVRFEHKLEPFSHVILFFRRRPHGQLVFITRAEAGPSSQYRIEEDIGRFALGSYMLELSDALTSEEAEAAGAYHLLDEALTALSRNPTTAALRQAFELKMLAWAGYGPEFGRCRVCGSGLEAGNGSAYFVASRGGVVCARCRSSVPEGAFRIEGRSAIALAHLQRMNLDRASRAESAGADGALVISRFLTGLLDRKLRSVEFLESVLCPPRKPA
jgi:DNA repair protein RecO (recombination protein O)